MSAALSAPPYPDHPGHKGASDTGRRAANLVAPRATSIRARVLDVIEIGNATAEQVADEINEHFMIVRARCSELRAKGLIEDSGQRGAGALGGNVIVWRSTSGLERALFDARKAAGAGQ